MTTVFSPDARLLGADMRVPEMDCKPKQPEA